MFVFFDVGGTLLRAPTGLADVVETLLFARRLVRSPETIRIAIERSNAGTPYGSLRTGSPETLEALFRHLDLEVEAPSLARELHLRATGLGAPALVPGTPAALERLHGAGVRLGAISNADDGLRRLLEHSGIARFLEVVMSSSRAGFLKPDRRIFEAALAEAGVAASEAWHVGDDYEADVRGARAAGMRAVWISESGARAPDAMVWTATRPDEAAYRILEVGDVRETGAA